jgi:hypothetical protein
MPVYLIITNLPGAAGSLGGVAQGALSRRQLLTITTG